MRGIPIRLVIALTMQEESALGLNTAPEMAARMGGEAPRNYLSIRILRQRSPTSAPISFEIRASQDSMYRASNFGTC